MVVETRMYAEVKQVLLVESDKDDVAVSLRVMMYVEVRWVLVVLVESDEDGVAVKAFRWWWCRVKSFDLKSRRV
jgi:hypothetical protein